MEPLLQPCVQCSRKTVAEAETQKRMQAMAEVWEECKLRTELALQVMQERGDEASVVPWNESKAASLAAETELVRMLLVARELGLDVEPASVCVCFFAVSSCLVRA